MRMAAIAIVGMLGLAHAARAEPAAQPPAAEDTTPRAWRIAAWSAAASTFAGAGLWFYGNHMIDDATSQLCAGGAYMHLDSSCALPAHPLDATQVQHLNDQGFRGQLLTRIGGAAGLLSGAFAAIAFYEGYVVDRRKDRVMIVAPIISTDRAGATLRVDW